MNRSHYEAMSDEALSREAQRRKPSLLQTLTVDRSKHVGIDRKRTIDRLVADDEELAEITRGDVTGDDSN